MEKCKQTKKKKKGEEKQNTNLYSHSMHTVWLNILHLYTSYTLHRTSGIFPREAKLLY